MDPRHTGTPVGRGVGPSVVNQLLRDRSLRLATRLAVGIGIPVAIMFYFQFRSLSDLGQASAVVLRQLSQETADAVTKDLQDALRAPRTDVLPADLPIPDRTARPAVHSDDVQSGTRCGCVRRRVLCLVRGDRRAPQRFVVLRSADARAGHEPAGNVASDRAVPRHGAGAACHRRVRGAAQRPAHLFPCAAPLHIPVQGPDDQLRRAARGRRAAPDDVHSAVGGEATRQS